MFKKFFSRKKFYRTTEKILSFFMILSLLIFQTFPVFLVMAQENSSQEREIEESQESFPTEKIEEKIEEVQKEDTEEEKEKAEEETAEVPEKKPDITETDKEIQNPEEDIAQEESCQEKEICPEISIENENEAVITDNIETVANTGGNEINGEAETEKNTSENTPESDILEAAQNESEGENLTDLTDEENIQSENEANVSVATEEAISETTVVNDINKNIVTQNGNDLSLNIYGDYSGEINLLAEFEKVLKKARETGEDSLTDIIIRNINNAKVENEVETLANTGGNLIESKEGDSEVQTGDAAAFSLVVNFINTNIVGNNWLFATLNIFGTWAGNLVVPGEGVLEMPASRDFSNVEIVNENEAQIENNVETVANSGENDIISENGSADIQTGEALAETSVKNIVNTSIVKNNWFFLLINNMGSWSGKLLGWDNGESDTLEYDFENQKEDILEGDLSVHNKNIAEVENNLLTVANTGENLVSGETGKSSIITEGAYAFSKVFNFINTNIVGDNWFFAVVNNMGNWQGDVEFAYPDLSISITDGKEKADFGEKLDYSVRIKNIGRAACQETHVSAKVGVEDKNWEIPALGAGEEKEFSFSLTAPNFSDEMEASALVQTQTEEKILENNSAQDQTFVRAGRSGHFDYNDEDENKISISRSSTALGDLRPGDHLKNSILLENSGETDVSGVVLRDTMLGEDGQAAVFYEWPIGDMKEGTKIRVEYEMVVNNPGRSFKIAYEAQAYGETEEGEEVESRKVRDAFTIFGFVLPAQAAEEEVLSSAYDEEAFPRQILGTEITELDKKLPILFWILAAISYALAINWAYFPIKKVRNRLIS